MNKNRYAHCLFQLLLILSGCSETNHERKTDKLVVQQHITKPILRILASQEDVLLNVQITSPNGRVWHPRHEHKQPQHLGHNGGNTTTHHLGLVGQDWYQEPGQYELRWVESETEHAVVLNVTGQEIAVDIRLSSSAHITRIYPSPNDVRILDVVVKNDEFGTVAFLLQNQSPHVLVGTVGLSELAGIVEKEVQGKWIPVRQSGINGDITRGTLAPGESQWLGEPLYAESEPLPSGAYRVVLRYKHDKETSDFYQVERRFSIRH